MTLTIPNANLLNNIYYTPVTSKTTDAERYTTNAERGKTAVTRAGEYLSLSVSEYYDKNNTFNAFITNKANKRKTFFLFLLVQ